MLRASLPLLVVLVAVSAVCAQTHWSAPGRGAKVAALIPGRGVPKLTRENLFADWCRQQVQRWQAEHGDWSAAKAFDGYVTAGPADGELTRDFPRHIAPLARVRSGRADPAKAEVALISYCPFCGSWGFSLSWDQANAYHATTTCCRTELYGRERDCPANYPLRPNATVTFDHLDGTQVSVPCTVYRDRDGVEWELFLGTLCDQRRWLEVGSSLVTQLDQQFEASGDPRCVHKIAAILNQVADTYYGLPLCYNNELAKGKDGRQLTRAEWLAVPQPVIFENSYLGGWNRRTPHFNKGWLNMLREHIWVQPFARARHHPSFKEYSRRVLGDPEALDRKVTDRLLREVAWMFRTVFSQKLLTNYQEANYVDLWLLGVLVGDELLIDFAGPAQEVAMYNHTYQDGLNGEGAPNYMWMPGGYFYPYLRDPKGWLRFYPKFLEEHPFYHAAASEMHQLTTVRGLAIEFGDQHEMAYAPNLVTDAAALAANEARGSRNWAGYGVGILRVGGAGHRQEVSLAYTRASLHNAQDALSLECWVDGVPVMRRGGYAAHWSNARLQWERPEFAALRRMGYPKEMVEGPRGFDSWTWVWAHSPLCQNGTTVDELGCGAGWGDNRGYGEVVTYKGGEPAGTPGSGFQVLDVRDHYSYARVGKDLSDFRRTLIGVEGPDGRPYVLDLLKMVGGQRQALYQSAVGERVAAELPAATGERAADLATAWFGERLPVDNTEYRNYRQVRGVSRAPAPAGTWGVTWAADAAAFAPRDPRGGAFTRPLPAGVGQVRLRLLGLQPAGGATRLFSGRGPWIGWVKQPLPGGQRVDGNVAFLDARDFLIEQRVAEPGGGPLTSLYTHVLEGFREGETSAIRELKVVPAKSVAGGARDLVALELAFVAGHRDTVIYQSEDGTVELADGLRTDARYALLRRGADGQVLAAELCRGTRLVAPGFEATGAGEFAGTIVDVLGDLTGTRRESALLIKPDRPWPTGDDLRGRQLLVRFESPHRAPANEGWRVERVTPQADGLLRVDVQDGAPFVTSWHQVSVLPADRPHVLRTWRPMVDHGNGPWYHGLKAWFPERGRTYTIAKVNAVGGGYGGDTLELDGAVNLAADGIKVGDWYVIHGVEPGRRVMVANELCWRREPAEGWRQYALRATGPAAVRTAATAAPLACRCGDGPWRDCPAGKGEFSAEETRGQVVRLLLDRPAWLKIDDRGAPAVTELALDGRALTAEQAKDLGWIEPPKRLTVAFRDADNPLDLAGLTVTLNGRRLTGPAVAVGQATEDGRAVRLEVDLAQALASEAHRSRRHQLTISLADRSIDRRRTTVVLAFISKVALETGVTYLSDLKPVSSFAHGGLITDRDYVGNPAAIAGRLYPKCLTLCPEPHPEGTHGEVVYELPARAGEWTFLAEVGISESAAANGSAQFLVQTGPSATGPWTTRHTSPVRRGGEDPVAITLPLGPARFLRLWTTDAGDGINSDHAVWGAARLK